MKKEKTQDYSESEINEAVSDNLTNIKNNLISSMEQTINNTLLFTPYQLVSSTPMLETKNEEEFQKKSRNKSR